MVKLILSNFYNSLNNIIRLKDKELRVIHATVEPPFLPSQETVTIQNGLHTTTNDIGPCAAIVDLQEQLSELRFEAGDPDIKIEEDVDDSKLFSQSGSNYVSTGESDQYDSFKFLAKLREPGDNITFPLD